MPLLREALEVMERLEPITYAAGYTLALYGSTLWKGHGSDIDLVAVPWRGDALAGFLGLSLSRHGYKRCYRAGGGGLGKCQAITLEDPITGYYIDLQVVP